MFWTHQAVSEPPCSVPATIHRSWPWFQPVCRHQGHLQDWLETYIIWYFWRSSHSFSCVKNQKWACFKCILNFNQSSLFDCIKLCKYTVSHFAFQRCMNMIWSEFLKIDLNLAEMQHCTTVEFSRVKYIHTHIQSDVVLRQWVQGVLAASVAITRSACPHLAELGGVQFNTWEKNEITQPP